VKQARLSQGKLPLVIIYTSIFTFIERAIHIDKISKFHAKLDEYLRDGVLDVEDYQVKEIRTMLEQTPMAICLTQMFIMQRIHNCTDIRTSPIKRRCHKCIE
jgi:hypothetical protein